ncbi:NAD(P)/FAD-dependent oxidoreductase [Conexibacter woesei]|uniref:Monooxygenase FAD-binding protein n=1 Tax=Conexibacter woesei (strain DSM 14684 / CCUG 47730 / CIP 108061 / JCM 11494 / NBRC 100937 / ID131577) TaxID=469383 RepID=D3FDN5_CONWI|nr:FAD-dependent monooxygenase [Conexibacter woesei]ADB49609.1 monooxygenase FAD-binding protein [Conexibacter woesei DSM 14684]
MDATGQRPNDAPEFDAVIVGASLAGSAAAVHLGREGARVALVEQRPDPRAYKRVCSHYVQASGVPAIERLGLLDAMMAAGAVRPHFRIWTRWGWIVAPPESAQTGLNLRRELFDPLLREAALATPGVEGLLGHSAERLLRDDAGRVIGVVVRDRAGDELTLRARLTIGADGRGSRVASLAGVPARVTPHGRFAYGAYFKGGAPAHAPDASVWMLDPHWAAAFPTDSGLTFYACMPTKARLADFRSDPGAALVAFIADLPDAPPIREGRRVAPVLGKLDMTNVEHEPIAPGLALIGDAALAADPLWGIGCGWALQSAEWLADAVAAPLAAGPAGDQALATGLARYRRRWRRGLRGHARVMEDLAGGRRWRAPERFVFAAATRDAGVAAAVDAFGARMIGPNRMVAAAVPRAVAANARHALARRPRFAPYRASAGAGT